MKAADDFAHIARRQREIGAVSDAPRPERMMAAKPKDSLEHLFALYGRRAVNPEPTPDVPTK